MDKNATGGEAKKPNQKNPAEDDAKKPSPKAAAEGEVKKKSSPIFPVVLVVVCLLLAAGGYAFARYTTSDRSALLIYSLILAAIVWGVFYLAFGLKKNMIKSGVTALALVVSLAGSAQFGWTLQIADAEQKFTERQQASKAIAAKKEAEQKKVAKPAAAGAEKTGDALEYERFANAYINKSEFLYAEYQHALDGTGWLKILDSDRIRQDKGLVESRSILQKAKDVVAKYRAMQLSLLADALKDIAALKVGEPAKLKITSTFNSPTAISAESIGALWDAADKQITEYEGIFNLLSNKKVTWMAQNGKVLFTEQTDLDVFNAHLAAVKVASKREDEVRQQLRDSIAISFEEPKPPEAKPGEVKPGEPKAEAPKADGPKTESVRVELPKAEPPKK